MTDPKLELKSEARRAVLRIDPTEVPRLVLIGIDGPSQYLMGLFGPMGLLLINTYFITVTNRSVYVHRGPRLKNRPEKLLHVIPLAQADGLVTRVKRGSGWNALYLQFPGNAKPTRLNVSFRLGDEMDRFLKMFPERTVHA
ncbi:hypothetical protein ACWD8L_33515 [Streptomyces sp. NPDC005133]|uniref:hypothetical protein n=1 Tax=Streptomyces sp. NBC_01617 TaxID=2975899 RepID=UPI0038657F81|nr:hypothetical protein OG784_37155 [Streptomyces sp. NBC_01617]